MIGFDQLTTMPTLKTPGATLLYTRSGTGPPVLLIQGVGVVGNGWAPQVEELSDRFTLVSFDNRGIGGSINDDGRLTIEDMAADALAVVDALGFERFHVVGHSMGGVIAQALALSAPGRITSLAFLCTFAKGSDGSKVTLPMVATALRMRVGTRPMRRNAFLELIMPERYLQQTDRAALAARLHPLFGHDLAEQPPIVMKQLGAMSKYDARARLGALGAFQRLWSRLRRIESRTRRAARRSPGRFLDRGTSRSPTPVTACPSIAPRRRTRSWRSTSRGPNRFGLICEIS